MRYRRSQTEKTQQENSGKIGDVAGLDEYGFLVDANLRRIRLATAVINEVQDQLLDPIYPHAKADLLLQTEALADATLILLENVRELVWANQYRDPTPDS
jgi:hypothetical protein